MISKCNSKEVPVDIDSDEIAAEWRRRARRDGLARVMRASQPPALATGVTGITRTLLAGYLDRVAGRLGRPVRDALEVGCGVGRLTPTIAGHAERVVALDMTDEMLAAARRTCAGLPNVEFRRGTAQQLPLGATRFDVAVSVWVLMHVLDDTELATIGKALAATARHLILIEYDSAAITVGRYSRLRPLAHYLDLLPDASVLACQDLDYGGDHSFAALLALQPDPVPRGC
jgi:SAM-dependent methyltransferase